MQGKKAPRSVVVLEHLSKTYGWTPAQIYEQPAHIIIEYLSVLEARAILEKRKA